MAKKTNDAILEQYHDVDLVGQLLMCGVSGTRLTAEETQFITEVQPAGIIYFKRNIASIDQVQALSRSIQRLCKIPAFIAIDQEGGRVDRLKDLFGGFPNSRMLADLCRRQKASKVFKQKAKAFSDVLKHMGINLNFDPVADIDTHQNNPIIGDRSFSKTAHECAHAVASIVEQYNKNSIVSCAKHFPGHGDTLLDSHLELPVVDTSLKTMLNRELRPFQKAILKKVPMIMTAHVKYKNIDNNIATQSKFWLQSILRKRLKFEGLIVSDDLEMQAVSKQQTLPDAAQIAIESGVDMLLVCESLQQSRAVYERLKKINDDNGSLRDNLKASFCRVLRLKHRFCGFVSDESSVYNDSKVYKYLAKKITESCQENSLV